MSPTVTPETGTDESPISSTPARPLSATARKSDRPGGRRSRRDAGQRRRLSPCRTSESITPGDMTTGIIDKTHLRSPGRHREKLATLRDSGPIACVANYRPTNGAHKQHGGDGFTDGYSLLALWRNVTENNFQFVLPIEAGDDGGTPPAAIALTIRGVVTKYQIGALTLDGKCSVTFEITPLKDYSDGLP